jgi:hypothetical protein
MSKHIRSKKGDFLQLNYPLVEEGSLFFVRNTYGESKSRFQLESAKRFLKQKLFLLFVIHFSP